jgi:hypothetical protein
MGTLPYFRILTPLHMAAREDRFAIPISTVPQVEFGPKSPDTAFSDIAHHESRQPFKCPKQIFPLPCAGPGKHATICIMLSPHCDNLKD